MYDAIVLAGGRARRLGGIDKPGLDVGGRSLLDLVLDAVPHAGTVVCAGPQRSTAHPVLWCLEDPPGAGPVAGLAAALAAQALHAQPHPPHQPHHAAAAAAAPTVLLLAADLPHVAPAVPALLAALAADEDADSAVLLDPAGRPNHLAAAWRRPALEAALAALGDPVGAPVRALGRSARVITVDDPAGWGRDCDTWDDVAALRSAVAAVSNDEGKDIPNG